MEEIKPLIFIAGLKVLKWQPFKEKQFSAYQSDIEAFGFKKHPTILLWLWKLDVDLILEFVLVLGFIFSLVIPCGINVPGMVLKY